MLADELVLGQSGGSSLCGQEPGRAQHCVFQVEAHHLTRCLKMMLLGGGDDDDDDDLDDFLVNRKGCLDMLKHVVVKELPFPWEGYIWAKPRSSQEWDGAQQTLWGAGDSPVMPVFSLDENSSLGNQFAARPNLGSSVTLLLQSV